MGVTEQEGLGGGGGGGSEGDKFSHSEGGGAKKGVEVVLMWDTYALATLNGDRTSSTLSQRGGGGGAQCLGPTIFPAPYLLSDPSEDISVLYIKPALESIQKSHLYFATPELNPGKI